MQYAASLPFCGDTAKAFGLAESALTALGFRFTDRTAYSMEWAGPGMNSSRESGLTRIFHQLLRKWSSAAA